MSNQYKQILLAIVIALCCAVIRLNADLLNGPYSKESQELVKLMKNPNADVPERFKDFENIVVKLGSFLQTSYGKFADAVRLNPTVISLAQNNTAFLEAIIQILKSKKAELEPSNISGSDYGFLNIALFASELNDLDLFEQAVKLCQQKGKSFLLNNFINDLFRNNSLIQNNLDKEFTEKAKKSYKLDKKLIRILSNYIDKETLHKNIEMQIYGFSLNFEDPINFLLSVGADINFVSGKKNPQTILDRANKSLEDAQKTLTADQESQDYYQQVQKTITFLKSKGAKTYAELTAAEKGQR